MADRDGALDSAEEVPSAATTVVGRLERLRPFIEDAGADGLLVNSLNNVRYLTGFSGSAALLLVRGEGAVLLTDGRYRTQAAEQLASSGADADVELFVGGGPEQRDALVGMVRGAVRRLGLEGESVSWAAQRRWETLLADAEPVFTTGLVEGLRRVKDDGELACMARAAAVADAALAEVVPLIEDRRSEAEVALALDSAMRRLGAEDRAFETIVACGPNAAKPHARPSDRRPQPGEAVVVDFGAVFRGYRSDMTRTFFVDGSPTPPMDLVLEVVSAAQAAGLAAVRAGVTGGDVDRSCRELITESGFGHAFAHGTGHGVGLEIHEAPAVGKDSATILEQGTVVTVEPGVYLAGVGGVRIEDTVVVTETGYRPLTRFPKERAS
jgi:Xaa-Pro aminopeptidase